MMVSRKAFLTFALPIVWIFVFVVTTISDTILPGHPTQLHRTFTAQSRFDIAVSMYEEGPTSVKTLLASIKATRYLSTLQARVIIYTKNPNSNLHELQDATGADTVEKLENLGREGVTSTFTILLQTGTI